MQIKKMKDIGQQLYMSQVNSGRDSLTMSPKQPHASRAMRADRQDAQAPLYQGSEAAAALRTIATCVKCRSAHEVPRQDASRGAGPSPKGDKYVCFRCSLGAPPARFHFVNGDPGAAPVGNKTELAAGAVSSKFKVRNFKPGKYYCDKCRFSTKDPLQYKKHTLQHEEIKFVCSHCSCVSYTKGEFQRHLVKHTGVFPYRCEYCDYGAIRNDYIVKHRRRVHERAGGKRPPKTAARLEPKRAGAPRPHTELFRAAGARSTFPGRLSHQLSRFSLHAGQDRARSLSLLPDSQERQKDVVCVPRKVTLSEPRDASPLENKSVEVEVLSPAREPVQPGMPLTVVAPAELVVPTNCLAQLMDVKVVNGTQQLLLKLFPLEENNGLEAGGGTRGVTKEKGSREHDRGVSAEQAAPLAIKGDVGKLAGLTGLQSSFQKQLKNVQWVRSYDLFMSSSRARRPGESLLHPEAIDDVQRRSGVCPRRALLPSYAFKGRAPPSLAKNSVFCDLGAAASPFPYKAAVSLSEDTRLLRGDSQELFFPLTASPATISFSGEKGLLPLNRNYLESRSEMSIPVTMVPPSRKLRASQMEERRTVPTVGQTSREKSEYSHVDLTGEDRVRAQPPGGPPAEVTDSEKTSDPLEGPIISSVFSLSSGSENVPEGVKWNSSTSKIKSIELLRRKIAQLIESCGKPSSLAASGAHCPPAGQASKGTSKASPANIQELSVSLTGSGFPLGMSQKPRDGGPHAPLPHPQVFPPFAESNEGKAGSRAARKAAVTAPVLIPKGAVLHVVNSSQDARIIEATCGAPGSVPCGSMQSLKPLPFCPVAQPGTGLWSWSSGSGPVDMSRNPDLPLRPKPRRESAVCGAPARRPSSLHGQQEGGELGKPGRLLSRSLPAYSRSKAKQVSSTKRKSKFQADASRCLKDPAMFQVARQLRLIAAHPEQLIKCPRRNQPVIVLNHPDVDSPEVSNVMKVINKYKGNVLKVVLSERTRCQLGIRRHHVRLTYQNVEEASQVKRQMMLKMKLKKVHKNNYQVVDSLPDDSSQCIFKCWFCGRLYEDQEEWMSHGQRHLIEATRDWDVLSSKGK